MRISVLYSLFSKPIDNIPKKKHCTFSKNKKDGMGKCRAVKPGGITPERRLEVTG